jgi:hypothetical protein
MHIPCFQRTGTLADGDCSTSTGTKRVKFVASGTQISHGSDRDSPNTAVLLANHDATAVKASLSGDLGYFPRAHTQQAYQHQLQVLDGLFKVYTVRRIGCSAEVLFVGLVYPQNKLEPCSSQPGNSR